MLFFRHDIRTLYQESVISQITDRYFFTGTHMKDIHIEAKATLFYSISYEKDKNTYCG